MSTPVPTVPADSTPVSMSSGLDATPELLVCRDLEADALADLLRKWGLRLVLVDPESVIPGSYWGAPEAGIIGLEVFVREDTPVHSALHEACHLLCADEARRLACDTDIGGDYAEEDAVCFLQILLANHLSGVGAVKECQDMDTWGYTFRLGSAQAWFEKDAEDAREWLEREGLIDETTEPTWKPRGPLAANHQAP